MFSKLLRSRIVKIFFATAACLLCLLFSTDAIAHKLGQSYVYLQVGEDTIDARLEIPVKELNQVLDLGFPADKKVRQAEIEPHLEQIQAYVDNHFQLSCQPQTCGLMFRGYDFLNTTFAQFLQLRYSVMPVDGIPDQLQVTYDVILAEQPQHINMLLIEENWQTGTFGNESQALLIFDQAGQSKTVDLTSGSLFRGFVGVVKLGIEHILEGIDHVLFLVALLLPSVLRRRDDRWQPVGKFSTALVYIIKIVTAFTIAHSITLCLATLQIVQVPSRLVESVIAASIGLAAVEIFYPIFRGRTWLIIFLFGLFHGFGFADALAELGVTSQHAALSLFGFNLGIEIGQIAIIAIVFPLLYLLRTQRFYPRVVLRSGGLLLGTMSLYWFIERAFDINLRVLPTIQGLI
ncbi:MAG: HupE/UreJ family protein [Leptolyngbya sp. SIO4C1]|nr:HupE/UreJ family protein [Leptolyngbya sp. SIO4C1]